MNKKRAAIPEGAVFVIPISKDTGVCAQVWTLCKRREIGHCGISYLSTPKGVIPEEVDWSDPSLYRGELNLIIDGEWASQGWPIKTGFRPARTPLREAESPMLRICYDLFGWRPEINSFVLSEHVRQYLKEIVERRGNHFTEMKTRPNQAAHPTTL